MVSHVSVEDVELVLDIGTYTYISTLHYEHLEGVFLMGILDLMVGLMISELYGLETGEITINELCSTFFFFFESSFVWND